MAPEESIDVEDPLVRRERRRRRGLLIFSTLYTFFFVGSFFGWGPMQLLLEENGSFGWKCDDADLNVDGVCPKQTASLLNIQFVASLLQLFSPLLGHFIDHYGPKYGAYVMAGCLWLGLAMLTVASKSRFATSEAAQVHLDRLLYGAFGFLAMGTWFGGLLTVQTGLYFSGHTKSRVIFLLNSVFDAGSMTYLFLWWLGDQVIGTNLTVIAVVYLVAAVIIVGTSLVYWTLAKPETSPEEKDMSLAGVNMADEDDPGAPQAASEVDTPADGPEAKVDSLGNEGSDEIVVEMKSIAPQLVAPPSYTVVADRSVQEQLRSGPVLCLNLFFALHVAANQWNLTTARDFLASLGDDELDNRYLTIFTLLMPASVVALPLVDTVILKFGFAGGFQGVNALALGYQLVKVASTNLNVQVLGFIFFSFFRSFLFGVTFSFLSTLLSQNAVGKSAGIMYALTAVASFINIPLADVAVKQYNGDFFIPNLVMLLLVIPCFGAAWGLGRYIRKERKAKARNEMLRASFGGVLLERRRRLQCE